MLWLPVRPLLELDGRLAVALPVRPLAEALPVRPLVPVDGRLLTVGRLLVVGLLTLPLLVRPELLPLTRPVAALLDVVGRLDMLPLVPLP